MSKYYIFGGLSFISGLVLVLYQAIASMMTAGDIVWKKLSLIDIAEGKYFTWVDSISWETIHGAIQYVITMPLYLLLIIVGAVLLIIGGFLKK